LQRPGSLGVLQPMGFEPSSLGPDSASPLDQKERTQINSTLVLGNKHQLKYICLSIQLFFCF